MSFIFNLTWREIRSSWRRLLFFFVCVGIGVGSIVALRSVIGNLNRAVAAEARNLLTADVEISTTAAWTDAELKAIRQVEASNQASIEARDEVINTNTMARPADKNNERSQMLELKGVDRTFPLVGDFVLSDARKFDYSLLENYGAIAAPNVLEKLNLRVGDKIRIGARYFEIRATFTQEPGGVSGFRLGPRVFIERAAFDDANLTNFGSRNRRRILYRVRQTEQAEPLAAQFRAALKSAQSLATAKSYKESQENLKDSFDRAENYLSLTGLVVLVLGGIGVWNVTRVFVEQKKFSIAVLKCLGASDWRVTSCYFLQIVVLGLLGSAFGVLLARLALQIVEQNFADKLPAAMNYDLLANAVWQGFLLGLSVSALFALLPLLQIGKIKPRLILRDQTNETIRKFSATNLLASAVLIAGLILLAVWQAGSWKIGLYFLGGLAATAAVLYAVAFVLTTVLKLFRRAPFFALRQAINSLHRPGNQTRTVLLAVGLGIFVVVSVQLLQANLRNEFDLTLNGSIPSLLLIDIPRAQGAAAKSIVKQETGENIDFIPAVRGRIAAINGEFADSENREIRRQGGQIGREYVLTYRAQLVGEEQVVEGEFWNETPATEPEVSLAEDMKQSTGAKLYDLITFDISGQKITARVTSFRRMDVRNVRSTFLIVFRPGTLEAAPQTLLAPVYADLTAAQRAKIQRDLIEAVPQMSVIDTSETVAAIRRLLANITLAISFVGGFVFLAGALILIGSIALTKFQRIYENAILKTLGARRGVLLSILLIEYGLLGALAGAIGTAAAIALSYSVAKYVFDITWRLDWILALAGFAITILLVTFCGAAASLDVLLKKPLFTLRSQQ
jgi:putative ABC transport system permease protein